MPLEFSSPSKQRIERLLTRYPTKQAALLPVLHVAQDEFGHLPDEALELVANTLELAPAHVFGVITFYTMFHREKHGRNELMVCTNVSCMLRGGYDILAPHREAAGHQGRRDHARRRLHPRRGRVPGRLRERADDDLRDRVLPGSDAREGRRDPRRPAQALARSARRSAPLNRHDVRRIEPGGAKG